MNLANLSGAVTAIRDEIKITVETARYQGAEYENGLEAKMALIRSATLIQRIHQVAKSALSSQLREADICHQIFPPIGETSPELNVWGLLKKKKQDIVAICDDYPMVRESITVGPLSGEVDELGMRCTNNAIVIGVRSQLSSIAKNFDTLMERAFAETLNLRMRHPNLVMGEVYMIAAREYDDQAMKQNRLSFKQRPTDVSKFIKIFNGMSHRTSQTDSTQLYRYDRSVLLIVDLSTNPVKIYTDKQELIEDGLLPRDFEEDYSRLSPVGFASDIVERYISTRTH
jgi:hypothetical protein